MSEVAVQLLRMSGAASGRTSGVQEAQMVEFAFMSLDRIRRARGPRVMAWPINVRCTLI